MKTKMTDIVQRIRRGVMGIQIIDIIKAMRNIDENRQVPHNASQVNACISSQMSNNITGNHRRNNEGNNVNPNRMQEGQDVRLQEELSDNGPTSWAQADVNGMSLN